MLIDDINLLSLSVHEILNNLFNFFQIENFRSLEDAEGNKIIHNFRPIQPINDRIVWFNSNDFAMDVNTLEEDNLYDKKDNDVSILSIKKRKNSGIKIKTKVSLIISLSIVTLLKIF